MQNSGNPFESPETVGELEDKQESTTVTRTLYVHCVALVGALVAFVGGFGAAFVVPTMLSQTLAGSRMWVNPVDTWTVAGDIVCRFVVSCYA